MIEFLKTYPFIVGALTGSLAVYLLNLLVSYLRRDKRWLGYSVTSRNVVNANHSKVKMEFEGKEIKRLDSHSISFRNIGNRPLVNLPVKIHLVGSGSIFESDLNPPEGADFKFNNNETDCLSLEIDLLNPGEPFSLGFTVADSDTNEIKVIARSEYLELREIGEQKSTVDILEVLLPHMFLGSLILDLYKISNRKK